MPEGHSIHRLAAAITTHFSGRAVAASSPQGRFSAGADILSGRVPLRAHAWGKHLFVPFISAELWHQIDDDAALAELEALGSTEAVWLHVHLGLYGAWTFAGDADFAAHDPVGAPRRRIGEGDEKVATTDFHAAWQAPEPRGAVRLRIETEHGVGDLTGPNQCRVIDGTEVRAIIDRLGPDPIRNDSGDRAEFVRRAKKRKTPIGTLVMDQNVVSGPGNIYRAECLFRTGINPYRKGAAVSAARLEALWDDLVTTMRDGVKTGQIWTVDAELAPIEPIVGDTEASRWAVYHRTGRPCLRCGATVSEAEMQGRRLFWCGGCQR